MKIGLLKNIDHHVGDKDQDMIQDMVWRSSFVIT